MIMQNITNNPTTTLEQASACEKTIVLYLRGNQEDLNPEIPTTNSVLLRAQNVELVKKLRIQYFSSQQQEEVVAPSALMEAPSLFIPQTSLVESNLNQIVISRSPELVNGTKINENGLVEPSLSEIDVDTRAFMVAIPDVNQDISSAISEGVFPYSLILYNQCLT